MKHCGTQLIETDRLILRRYTADDAEAMFKNWASDPEVTRFLTWPTHTGVDVTREVIASWLPHYAEDNYYHWTITRTSNGDEPLGDIAVVRQSEEASMAHIGYSLGRKWWHQGITSEALKAVMDYLFDVAGFDRIEARHDPDNPNSGKVMMKCGMRFEGMKHDPDMKKQGDKNACFYSLYASDRKGEK